MASDLAGLASYLIHYSPLVDRLKSQTDSASWKILSPTVITEQHSIKEGLQFPYAGDLGPLTRAEIMAQCSEIIHILSLHSESIRRENFVIRRADLRKISFGNYHKLALDYYLQAMAAHSRKNYELTCQHLKAIELFIKSGKDYCLILEDDAIPINDNPLILEKELEECLRCVYKLNEGYFDISNSLGFSAYRDDSTYSLGPTFTQMAAGQTRCASSYLLSRRTANLIVSKTDNIVLPVDWHISYILCRFSCPTFWYNKPIFAQGSQSGQFSSNQALRNK